MSERTEARSWWGQFWLDAAVTASLMVAAGCVGWMSGFDAGRDRGFQDAMKVPVARIKEHLKRGGELP